MKKGFTLVEVLVSLTVFVILFGCVYGIYETSIKNSHKYTEYLYFESICQDIALYGDKYGRNWDMRYWGDALIHEDGEGYAVCYDEKYNPSGADARYTLTYFYNAEGELILSVKYSAEDYYVIKDLNYGRERYEE